MTDKRVVLSTTASEEEARQIARHLVERHLAACVNLVPLVESVFRWQGRIEASRECLMLIKTSADQFPGVRDAIRELHSYDLPECIAVSIEEGSSEYLDWLGDSLGGDTAL